MLQGILHLYKRTPKPLAPVALDETIYTQATNGRYNAFGSVFAVGGNQLFMPFRSGSSHTTGGRVDAIWYDITQNTWSISVNIYTTPVSQQQMGDARGGVLGGEKIIVFTTRITDTGSNNTFVDMGYVLSTNLSGNSWSSYNTLALPSGVTAYQPYGSMLESDTPGVYYQPAYGYVGTTQNVVWLDKMT